MLTIGIPTYNREKQLMETLRNLQAQTNQNFRILISDNHSEYDIRKSLMQNFDNFFLSKIDLIVRNINVGADNNIVSLFERVTKGWLWIVSDDDVEKKDAVETIYKYINKYPDYAVIQFSFFDYMDGRASFGNIIEFTDFLYDKVSKNTAQFIWGDFASSLNKVYNMDVLIDYVYIPTQYSNCCMTTGVAMLSALNNNKKVLYTRDSIAIFGPSFWNVKKVALAARALGDIEFKLDYSTKKKLLYITNMPYRIILHYWLRPENHYDKDHYIEKLYYGFYKFHLPLKDRIDYWIRMKLFSLNFIYKIHIALYNLEHKLKNRKS